MFFFYRAEESSADESEHEEFSDKLLSQLMIITESSTPPVKRQYDRTGDYQTRVKMTQQLASEINDGLRRYEHDLWTKREVVKLI